MKRWKKILLGTAGGAAAVLLAYVGYVFAAYDRLEDCIELTVDHNAVEQAEAGVPYTLVSYNVGFGAYSADYSFFMDGGTESRAYSAQAVRDNLTGAMETVQSLDPDFVFLQEVDQDATRSHHVDETELVREALSGLSSSFAQNYDSPYLFWPILEPHGASKSGILTFSGFKVDQVVRRSLPIATGPSKLIDLDRCYSVSTLPVSNGRNLRLYNVHLSAYLTDGEVATKQMNMLLDDMYSAYAAGDYVVCGGDFNKDLLGDSSAVFGVSGSGESWAAPFPEELLPEGITLAAPLEEDVPVPSCRNADAPYDPQNSFVLTVDGFLVSDNVEVRRAWTVDTGFAWSDHNPVALTFTLRP